MVGAIKSKNTESALSIIHSDTVDLNQVVSDICYYTSPTCHLLLHIELEAYYYSYDGGDQRGTVDGRGGAVGQGRQVDLR